jgi:hypothetical protein
VRRSKLRISGDGLFELFFCLGIAMHLHIEHGEICIDDGGKRVERKRNLEMLQRFFHALLRNQKYHRIKVVSARKIWIKFQRAVKLFFRLAPSSDSRQCAGPGVVCFGQGIIQFHCFLRGRESLRYPLLRSNSGAIAGRHGISVGQSAIGKRVAGVGCNRLLK